ncbi:MAG: amidohydrolase [Bryobacterales bacterium]|nr:amidohydrolase [Bryobacterales bacterium]
MRIRCFVNILVFCTATAAVVSAQQADVIIHNAKVVTVDAQFRIAQALAVKGDRLLAVGSNTQALALKGANTKLIDAGGKTILPGLIDSHVHAADASMYEFDHAIPTMETIADVLRYYRSRAAVVPRGEWIRLSQVFITRLRERRYPTRAELDSVAPNHPAVFATGPDASLNTLALKKAGITKDSKPPAGQRGKVELDAKTGEPTGILRSASQFLNIPSTGRKATDAERAQRLKMLLADYNSVGLTSVAERDASESGIELYRSLWQKNELTCRVFLNAHIEPTAAWEKVEAQILKAARDPLHKYDKFLWLRGTKSYLDGGMLTGSAYMREPWGLSKIYSITDPNYRGLLYIEAEPLYRAAKLALQNDLQFTAHSVGDGAVNALITAYERINKEFPVRAQRPCITHCNFMFPEAIDRMRNAGIVADLQPAWLERDGATLREQFGDPRLAYFQPYKSLFDAKVPVGGGSDHMQKIGSMRAINPYNPFYAMWVTLARQPRWTDKPLHPEQRITREQAIRLYTINNAFLTFEEKEKGSLEPNKLADFIILKEDILTVPVDRVKDLQVAETWLDGRQVYRAAGK